MLPNKTFFQANHIGIALTNTAVRTVAVGKTGQITTYAQARLSQPLIQAGSITIDSLRQALGVALKEHKLDTNLAAVCIPEKYAFSREYFLPKVKVDEIAEAITWQLEKIFPFSANEIYTDWKLLSVDKNGAHVFVVAIPKNLLDQLKTALEGAGFIPISFEPSASAITRLIPKQEKKNFIAVELDETGSTSTLVVNGISSITTTTSFSTNDDPQETLNEIAVSITNLVRQLEHKGGMLEGFAIYLAGEKSSEAMAKLLQAELSQPVTMVNLPQIKPEQQLGFVAASTRIQSPSSTKTINLLPTILQEHFQAKSLHLISQVSMKIIIGLVLPSLLLSLAGLVITQVKLNSLQADLASTKATTNQNKPDSPQKIAHLSVPEINKMVQRINKLFSQKVSPEQPITQILNLIPESVTIANMTFERGKKQFTLVGLAKTRQDLLLLQGQLESDESIAKVTLPLSSLETTEDIQFSISFIYEPKAK